MDSQQEQGDLTATFGTPARALSGLLSRRTAQPLDPAPDDKAVTPAPAPATSPAPPRPKAQKAASRSEPAKARTRNLSPVVAGTAAESTSQVAVYLLPEAIRAARAVRAATGQTNAQIAWEAIDATHPRLPELVAGQHVTAARPAGSLFPTRRTTARTVAEERRTLWAVRATPAELAVVDRLVVETGASSRSALIATAVETHLKERRQP